MSPDGMAFADGTAQVRAARAGLRPAPTARVGGNCFGLTGNRDEAGKTTGLSRSLGWLATRSRVRKVGASCFSSAHRDDRDQDRNN